MFQIESRSTDTEAPSYAREWSTESVEATPGTNEFATREEAEAAIEELRKLGDEWATAEYRVREMPQQPA